MDREKVIKGLEICRHRVISQENCMECPYIYDGRAKQSNCEGILHWDAIAMLKEQQEEIENLKQTAQSMMEGVCLLKEQEAVKPRVSSVDQRCGNCNKVIEMDGWQSCPWCGKRIDWKGWWKKNGTRNQDS